MSTPPTADQFVNRDSGTLSVGPGSGPTHKPPEAAKALHWFALLGGALAWATQFLVGYLVTEGVCVGAAVGAAGGATDGPATAAAAVANGTLAVVLVSLVAFTVAVLAALAGRRLWRRGRDESEGGSGWVGLAGLLLSGVFAFVIAIQVLPLFLGGGCT